MSHWTPKGRLRYPDYLRLGELLSLQHPVSDPPHHDETLFVIVHQAFELWFKLMLHSIDELNRRLDADDVRTALKLARRAATIQRSLVQQIDILETMSALDFLEFRTELEGASGFQSAQFRELEAALGLADEERVPVALQGPGRGRDAYYAPLLAEERARVERRLAEPGVEERFLDLVVRRVAPRAPECAFLADLGDLLEALPEAARAVLGALTPLARVAPAAGAGTEEGPLGMARARLEQLPLWAKLTAPEREALAAAAESARTGEALRKMERLDEGSAERTDVRLIDEELARQLTVPLAGVEQALAAAAVPAAASGAIRRRLLRRTSLREVYRRAAHRAPDGMLHELWLLAEALADLAQALSLYRFRHVQMVERMIGKRRGTGGSPGAAYLEKTLVYRSFPEILRVRTYL